MSEVVCNMIGVSIFISIVKEELLQICRPLMMEIVLQLPLCLYKLKRSIIDVDDHLILKNVMVPFPTSLHDGTLLFIICGLLSNCIKKCLTMIGHLIPVMGRDCTNSIVKGICLNFK